MKASKSIPYDDYNGKFPERKDIWITLVAQAPRNSFRSAAGKLIQYFEYEI